MKLQRGRPRLYDPAQHVELHVRHFPKVLQQAVQAVATRRGWTYTKALTAIVQAGLERGA
jgi:hypothetical protein